MSAFTIPRSDFCVPTSIVVGGTIAIDHVKTPDAEATDLLGGSAAYAALAASFSGVLVHLVGIVGKDFPKAHLDMLESRGICLEGVERSDSDSFTWSGEYMPNMNERVTHRVGINVLENWRVKVPAAAAAAPIVVLANMSPDNQLEMLEQCGITNAERGMRNAEDSDNSELRVPGSAFVVADTMDLWIEIANERLHEVLRRIDLFVINEGEAREFAGTSNLVQAGRILLEKGPRHVVIKLGEFGAMLFSGGEAADSSNPQFFRSSAFPLERLADPTGAGDTFLGAIAGHLAANGGDFGFEEIRRAVIHGTILASFTCEAFSTRRLETLQPGELEQRLETFRRMTAW